MPTHGGASSTKTFAAVLLLVSILPRDDLIGLNRFGDVDHVDEFTVRDVLAHTSGIPNYYATKALDSTSDIAAVTSADPGWSYADTLEIARGMTAAFAPHSGRAEPSTVSRTTSSSGVSSRPCTDARSPTPSTASCSPRSA